MEGRPTSPPPGPPTPERSRLIRRDIEVRGARNNNLKNLSLDIPKQKITVFTGVSGSGKSSLAFGTIAAESQRLIKESYPAFIQSLLPRYGQPDVDSLDNLTAAIVVDQQPMGGNARSTIGTATDAHTLLRLIYSRVGEPGAGGPKAFSFNEPQGMCPGCEGLGQASNIDVDALLDRSKSLNEGAIRFPAFAPDTTNWNILISSGFFDNDKPVAKYTDDELDKLLHLKDVKVKTTAGGKAWNMSYEGLLPRFKRLFVSKGVDQLKPYLREAFEKVVRTGPCTDCGGTRLNAAALACRIGGVNIAECAAMEVRALAEFVTGVDEPAVAPVTAALAVRLESLVHIGLGYLTLDRESSTLSGGESQRVKMVRHLGSSLTEMTYVFDEPSVGLHPHDVRRLNELLVRLRDRGNTVLVVEHKPEIMAIADHIVDLGPHAGREGGEVVYQGDFAGLRTSGTVTGKHLDSHQEVKEQVRTPTGHLRIANAQLHNLRDVTVDVPEGVLTVVTGVAGSGKSSLMQVCLPQHCSDAVLIDQDVLRGSKRSNPATYTGMLDPIRKAFAGANGVDVTLFSANSKGACPDCHGLGLIYTDLAHLDPVVSTCDTCDGRRFTDEVLEHQLRGRTISEVLGMSVTEAAAFFTEPEITETLAALENVGLGYITLWQPVSTLSGGERQRLKLASELGNAAQVYVLDEPTTGLHMNDVDTLIDLLDRMVDAGGTVIVIEHNLDVVARADWVIDLGPGAGKDGGRVVFEGPPAALAADGESVTGTYLRQRAQA